LVRAAVYLPGRRFQWAAAHPEGAQEELWRAIWSEVGDSPFWRRYAPSSRLSEFPIRTYEAYQPAIQEGFETGVGQLSTRPVRFYAITGGTTRNRPKRFPVTDAYAIQHRRVSGAFAWSLMQRTPDFRPGKVLSLSATAPVSSSPTGVPVGFISWYASRLGGRVARRLSPLPDSLLQDDDAYHHWAPLYALGYDLVRLAGINASTLRAFALQLDAQIDAWWPYLEGKKKPPGLPSARAAPARLTALRKAFSKGRPTFRDIWPSLRSLVCWRAGVCGLQLSTLEPWLGDLPVRDAPLLCTEAWLTVPLWDERVGGVLHPSANVVEFLPLERDAASDLLAPWELTAGEDYEVVLTTSMGLVRYRLQDVVRCTGYYRRSPVLVFRHKAASILRVGQVSIAESDVIEVLATLGLQPARTWCMGPNDTGDGLRIWVKGACDGRTEADVTAQLAQMASQLTAIEEGLATLMPVYDHDRRVGWMRAPDVSALAADHPVWDQPTHAQAKPRLLLPTWQG
jgi:hypothetical protein